MLPLPPPLRSSGPCLDGEDMTAMAELPFVNTDIREVFEVPLQHKFKPQRKRRRMRVLENPQQKWESCRRKHQEMDQKKIQVDGSPEGAQQVSLPGQLGQGEDHLPAAQLPPPGQQPQGGDDVHVQLQNQTGGGDTAPKVAPHHVEQGWDALEVTVQVQPQKRSWEQEFPEVTVQVRPQKQSSSWEPPPVTVQVQLQPWGQGPHVTLRVQPQEGGHGRAGIKVVVQLGCDHPEEATCLQDPAEGVLGNGEHPPKSQGDPTVRSEGEREVAVEELVPQGALSPKQERGGEVTKPQQDQSQEEGRVEVVELQDGDPADLDGMVVEEQLQEQSQEQEELTAELPLQKEDQQAPEVGQEQHDVQEEPKEMLEDQKEDLGQKVSKKHLRGAPNYFVAIPITSDLILQRIENVQELIVYKEPDLLRALLPRQTMHLTILVAHLRTEEEVQKAVLALKESKAKVEAVLEGKDLQMRFHGIGQFNQAHNQVIYVQMQEEEQKKLRRIAKAVKESFTAMDLDISGSKRFRPHLTFLKLSKAPRLRRRGFRRICPDLYRNYEDSYFGSEVFSRIDLCAMHKKKQESGYYYCECSIYMGSSSREERIEQEIQTEDMGEATSEEFPPSAEVAEIGATAASCQLPSCLVVAEDKPSENVAEASIASEEKEMDEVKGQPGATDGISLAAGEICSKLGLGLLPASSDALRNVEKEEEEAKITDGSLQRAEAMEDAPHQSPSSG